jgi:ABC-type lipoprotein release transport system permease subunit
LRALGFSRGSILTTFVLESMSVAMVGGRIGFLIALPVNEMTSAAGGPNFVEVAFTFLISGTCASAPPWPLFREWLAASPRWA